MRSRIRLATLLALLWPLALCASCLNTRDDAWLRAQRSEWRLVELEGRPALEDVPITLRLEGEQRLFGDAGVNTYFGSFERRGSDFRVAGLASTRRAGPPYALDQERRYLALLDRVDAVRLVEERLVLSQGGADVLVFAADR